MYFKFGWYTSYKNLKIKPLDLLFLLLLLAFTSADINFYKFLEPHSTLSEKKIVTNFPFLMDSPPPPSPPTSLMTKIC